MHSRKTLESVQYTRSRSHQLTANQTDFKPDQPSNLDVSRVQLQIRTIPSNAYLPVYGK